MSKSNKKERKPRNFTAADAAAADRLRKLWDAAVTARRAAGRPLTQELMAERMSKELGKGSQSSVAQYLGKKLALNYKAVLAFSAELGCAPEDIRDDLPEQSLEPEVGALPDHKIAKDIAELREDVKALTLALGTALIALRKFQPIEAADVHQALRSSATPRAISGRVIPQLLSALEDS